MSSTDPAQNHPFASQTSFLLQWAHQSLRKLTNEALKPLDIDVRHLGVLTLLAPVETLSQRQIGSLLNMDKSIVVYLLDELERRALVERQRDAHDRRAHAVRLTAAGRHHLQQAQTAAAPVNDQVLAALNETDRQQLNSLLKSIIDSASH